MDESKNFSSLFIGKWIKKKLVSIFFLIYIYIYRAKLQQELNQLRQQFTTIALEHREQEQLLRKEKLKHETNVEGIIGRYDEDMIKKQDEFDEIEEMHEEEMRQLTELEEKFKPLEEEYKQIMEEKHMQETLRRMQEESLNKKIKAAIVIQSYWRGFKLRKGLFKKRGGGGGKKGKKKWRNLLIFLENIIFFV